MCLSLDGIDLNQFCLKNVYVSICVCIYLYIHQTMCFSESIGVVQQITQDVMSPITMCVVAGL